MITAYLPIAILLTSLLAAPVILMLPERANLLRTSVNVGAALLKVGLVLWLAREVAAGTTFDNRLTLLPGLDLVLQADALSVLFLTLSAVLWLLTTIYAVGYLQPGDHRSRFFGFFSLCVAATVGIAMSGNLFTFLIFFEALTLATYPLIVHKGKAETHKAGRKYLTYTLGGGLALTFGVAWLHVLAGSGAFVPQGYVAAIAPGNETVLTLIFVLLIAGVGVKAALVPLHSWLPLSMVAPAPVSALLHAVAVVKAGAFGIMRIVYDVYGVTLTKDLGLATPLAALAAVTILYGSIRALREDDLKRRLAYSTVSQVSYITLGVAVISPLAAVGGLAHLIHQGLMKITMFLCAGNIAEARKITRVSQMDGLGPLMPSTMVPFTIAVFGMIGIPPLAGFVSKWFLANGSIIAGDTWVVPVLLVSSLLNACYFLPILYRVWFKPAEEGAHPVSRVLGWMLVVPPVATATLVILAGLLANAPFAPLGWTEFIVRMEYS